MLSDLISQFDHPDVAAQALLQLDDLALSSRVVEVAMAEQITIAEIVRQCVRNYANRANEEEWVTLMGALARSNDPARVFLHRALKSCLAHPSSCTCDAAHPASDELHNSHSVR